MSESKILPLVFLFFTLTLLTSCRTPDLINQGEVSPAAFYTKINFETAKNLILVPCTFEGETKNFLFDTGATVNTIQRDSIYGKKIIVRGASNRTKENGTEILNSFKINDIDFKNTFATNEDMEGLKEQIPNFGGVLGRSIMNKANWLIDNPAKILEISSRDLSDSTFTTIKLDQKKSAPIVELIINGKAYNAIIDLGSVATFNVPLGTDLADELLSSFDFIDEERERYTVGGLEKITEKIGIIPSIDIGELTFKNIRTNINQSSQIRLGMNFFKDFKIYIDNINSSYRIKQVL